jgi:transposase
MAGFIEGIGRGQTALFPERLEDWIGEDHLVRVVDLFVDELDLPGFGFVRSAPARTGRPGYHPAVLLKLFIYGYRNRIPSSRVNRLANLTPFRRPILTRLRGVEMRA